MKKKWYERIEWKKITWYSNVLAVVLFLAIFALGFYVGFVYKKPFIPDGWRGPTSPPPAR